MKQYTYQDCLEQTLHQVKRYNTIRKNNKEWDKWELQEIRDELSEALVFFGPYYADLRADAEQAKVDCKQEYEKRCEHWRDEFDGVRGTASRVTSKATLDCSDFFNKEIEANRQYYRARTLVNRIDQVLNSIASRLKLDKHDKES